MEKKALKRILAIVAVLALMLGVLSSCGDSTQAKIDEAVQTAKDAAAKELDEAVAAAVKAGDDAKAELESQITDLTTKLAETEEAAKAAAETAEKDKEDALAAAQAAADEALAAANEAADEALKTAQEEADKVKTDLEGQVADLTAKLSEAEGQVADLTAKLTEAEEAAKAAADSAENDKEDALTAAKNAADEALKSAQDAADKVKTELEGKVADLTDKLAAAEESAKTAAEEAAKNLENALKDAADAAAKEKDEALAAAKTAADDALKAAQDAADKVKAELESKIADLTKQIEDAAAEVAVMSHAEYVAAEMDSEVCVETYVQATQSWWDNKITIYAQSEDGAYFIYNAACSEEDAAKLVPGTKIIVKGYKSEWSGEVEITDATFEIVEGEAFIAEAIDATDLLGKDELADHQNELVSFKGLVVEAQDDGEPFNYKDSVGKTDDLYVRFVKDDVTCNFCVEFYLCGNDTDVYKAVEGLQVGDVVDIEGFLYWYNGANVHMTKLTKAE